MVIETLYWWSTCKSLSSYYLIDLCRRKWCTFCHWTLKSYTFQKLKTTQGRKCAEQKVGQGKTENTAYVKLPLNHVQSSWWQFQYVSGEQERGICKWTKWCHWWLKTISKCPLVEEYHVKTLGCSWLEIYFQVHPKCLSQDNIYYITRNMKHLTATNFFL